jgi:hypothetical protein
LAGIAALAEFPDRVSKVLATPYKNKAGIYALNVWVRGIPTLLLLDDFVPLSSSPYFAKTGTDGSLWGPLFEKAWSKVNGNYEAIVAGFPSEAFEFLTNVPSSSYEVKGALTGDSLWAIV